MENKNDLIKVDYSDLFLNLRSSVSTKNLNFNQIRELITQNAESNVFCQHPVNLLSWNVNCLTHKKLVAIRHYLDDWTRAYATAEKRQFIDFLTLTETWLSDESKYNTLSIRNFNNYYVNRDIPKKGGGIMVYVNKNFPATVLESDVSDDIEYLLLKVIINGMDWYLLTIYRPFGDESNFLKILESVLCRVNTERLIISGDLNLNYTDSTDKDVVNYRDLLTTLNLSVVNSAVTRLNRIIGVPSLIDHIVLSNIHTDFLTVTSTRIRAISDHNCVMLMLQIDDIPEKKPRREKIKRINYEQIVSDVSYDLSLLNYSTDCNSYFNDFHDVLKKAINANTKTISCKLPSVELSRPSWTNDNYQEMLNSLHNLEEKIDKRRDEELPYEFLQKKFNEMNAIRENYGVIIAKKYYRKLEINNLRHAWSVINELIGREKKNKAVIIKSDEGDLLIDPLSIANAFQQKFLSVVGETFPAESANSCTYIGPVTEDVFEFEDITAETISLEIAALDVNKSVGHDGVSAKILKKISNWAKEHLAQIFNLMVKQGVYIDELKKSIVIAVPKGSDAMDINNNRPISILLQIDKIFESILYKQLNSFLESHETLDKLQYGFRNKRGCQDALCMILNHVSKIVDEGKGVVMLSLDIKKAFDSVNHEILLKKLNLIGIRGVANDLIKNFLTGRTQIVKFNDQYSDIGEVRRGVVQGANLGPLLFNLMITDLANLQTHSTLYKYADDLIVLYEIDGTGDSEGSLNGLSSDFNTIMNYYETNCLEINCMKSKYIIMGKTDEKIENFLDSQNIEKCNSLTYLGFVLDSDLKMMSQVDKICKSIGQSINVLRFLRDNLCIDSLIKFFHAHIQSTISYCAFALLRCRSIDVERIQRLQSKALKIIFNENDRYPTIDLFTIKASKILPVTGLIYYSVLMMIKKSLLCTDNSLPVLQQLKTKRRFDLLIGRAKKKIMEDDISHHGVKLFNQLPNDVKIESNIYQYKDMMKKYLLSRNSSLVKTGQFASKCLNL